MPLLKLRREELYRGLAGMGKNDNVENQVG
jgi:hypothetical protein